MCVSVLLDLRVVHKIVWPFSGKSIRYPQLYPGNAGNSHSVTENPTFSHFCYICQSKAFHSSGKLLFILLLESKHSPGGAKSVFRGGM